MKNGTNSATDSQRFRIRHPSFGYLLSMKRTEFDGCKYSEEFTRDPAKARVVSLSEIRQPMDANGNGLMTLLVQSYTGLTLEEVSR